MRTVFLALLIACTPERALSASLVFVPSVDGASVTSAVEIGQPIRFDTYLSLEPDEPVLGIQLELEFGHTLGPVIESSSPGVPWTLTDSVGVPNQILWWRPRGDFLFLLTYDEPGGPGGPLTLNLARETWGDRADWDDLGGTALYMGAFTAQALSPGPVTFELIFNASCIGPGDSNGGRCTDFDYTVGDRVETGVVVLDPPSAGTTLPEPTALALLGAAFAALLASRRWG